jgi:tRNA threonylcarbamoyladenosine biosynthesis protein TsaB
MMEEQGLKLKDLHAIAISEGPGSYTGLRVGMAAAKGICYALDIPLIMVSTLKMMANSASPDKSDLLCPMIDARRMEVFTALYDKSLNEVQTPVNMILSEDSFKEKLDAQSISFFGNGSQKFKGLISHPNANFQETEPIAAHMIILSYNKFKNSEFADLAYSEPFYGKDFHSSAVI